MVELSPRVFFHQGERMLANVPETSNFASTSFTLAVIGMFVVLSSAPFYAQAQTQLEAIIKSERASSSVLNYTQVSVYEHGEPCSTTVSSSSILMPSFCMTVRSPQPSLFRTGIQQPRIDGSVSAGWLPIERQRKRWTPITTRTPWISGMSCQALSER